MRSCARSLGFIFMFVRSAAAFGSATAPEAPPAAARESSPTLLRCQYDDDDDDDNCTAIGNRDGSVIAEPTLSGRSRTQRERETKPEPAGKVGMPARRVRACPMFGLMEAIAQSYMRNHAELRDRTPVLDHNVLLTPASLDIRHQTDKSFAGTSSFLWAEVSTFAK